MVKKQSTEIHKTIKEICLLVHFGL